MGCSSNHHVSPWGQSKGPPLGAFVEGPDLDARLAEVDREASQLGLTLDREIVSQVKGARFVARAYSGKDAVERTTHATRVVTPFGVVLAAGPSASSDVTRRAATELVPAVGDASELASLRDLTGAGALDVVLRADDGRLEVWRVESRGSQAVEIDLEVAPTSASDIDGDGHVEIGGRVLVREGEALCPELVDVATFDGVRFSNRTEAARAWHAHERDVRRARIVVLDAELASKNDAPDKDRADRKKSDTKHDDTKHDDAKSDDAKSDDAKSGDAKYDDGKDRVKRAERARVALELAWHAILAGEDRAATLDELKKTKPPRELEGAFSAYAARIARIDR